MSDKDIYAAAHLFDYKILLYTPQTDVKWLIFNDSFFDLSFVGTIFDETKPSLLLSRANGIHYYAVIAAAT